MRIEPHLRPRRITLERVFNFRDLGGYTASEHRTVRWGLIYRADGIHRLEGGDLARVAGLGIRTVLDLRTRGELADHGRVASESIAATYRHLPLLEQVWERDLPAAEIDAVGFLAGRYLEMLDTGASSIVTALAAMADAARLPLVFHCSAGKDRTGVLAAILLSVLGVSDDDIAADCTRSAEMPSASSRSGFAPTDRSRTRRWRHSRPRSSTPHRSRSAGSSPALAHSTDHWPSTCAASGSPAWMSTRCDQVC